MILFTTKVTVGDFTFRLSTIRWMTGAIFVKFNQLILVKIKKIVAMHQTSDFNDKMHQIQFRLKLRRRPCWESLQHSPRTLARFKGAAYF